jgi:hypothetical protein
MFFVELKPAPNNKDILNVEYIQLTNSMAEIKCKLTLSNAHYFSFQNPFSSHLMYKNLKIKIQKTISKSVVFYLFEALYLTLREAHRLEIFESRVLR